MAKRNNVWANIDWVTISLYLVLILMGWFNIYAASYSQEHQSIFDFSQRYGKQIIWIVAALVLAFIILIIDINFYVAFSYAIYGFMILLLLLVLLVGKEINGAKSWFVIGGFSIQPSEFAKFATALALARFMSSFNFKLKELRSKLIITAIIGLPMSLILLQNDAGSALVYFTFLLVLYREGLSGAVLLILVSVAAVFIMSLIVSPLVLTATLLIIALLGYLFFNNRITHFYIVVVIYLLSIVAVFIFYVIAGYKMNYSLLFLYGTILGSIVTLIFTLRSKLKNYLTITLLLFASLVFSISVDYAFDNLLEEHHQNRINEFLGIDSDPLGAGYNVNQSKIAIGSGGLTGKGFLKGTQTKFDFVPEQSTDFIFCTAGEEWGFFGSVVISLLFLSLFIRLIFLAEKQRSIFSRVYGHAVAVILFFHYMINIGMTIGLMPVIGIPLPFFSYGGSSLWSFTILLFIFVRLDASRLDVISG